MRRGVDTVNKEVLNLLRRPEGDHSRDGRDGLLEQLHSLSDHLVRECRHTRNVSSRPSQTSNDTSLDGIRAGGHDDRDSRSRLLHRRNAEVPGEQDDHVDPLFYELGSSLMERTGLRPTHCKYVSLTLPVPQSVEAAAQRR